MSEYLILKKDEYTTLKEILKFDKTKGFLFKHKGIFILICHSNKNGQVCYNHQFYYLSELPQIIRKEAGIDDNDNLFVKVFSCYGICQEHFMDSHNWIFPAFQCSLMECSLEHIYDEYVCSLKMYA